jgi:KDO2-lipid IV(A) lauroyltransferase
LQGLLYYISLPFIYLLAILPFRVLYLLSDGVYLLLYYGVGYRKKVVWNNLKKSFPEKSDAEIRIISKAFYKYFCDLFLETFKTLTISKSSMLKRCSLEPSAVACFNELAEQKKNIIIVMGHSGNWEWAGNTFSLCCRHQLYVIYHPLENKYFNALITRMRGRFGTRLIAMKDTLRDMVKHRHDLTATAFIADQSPNPDKAFWMSFMNQDTPVFLGTEKIARKMQYTIVYVSVKKIKRGYYRLLAQELPYSKASAEGEITVAHTQKLESDINNQPETWLWSHRRWKHTRNTTTAKQ